MNGYGYLKTMHTLMNPSISNLGACYAYYLPSTNSLYLYKDNGIATIVQKLGVVGTTISNSQCTIDTGSSWAAGSGNTLTLNLAISFTTAFAGAKNVYGYTADSGGLSSGWKALGTWYTGSLQVVAPTADSVTPASGTGTTQTLAFKYSSVNSYAYLTAAHAIVSATLTNVNSCYAYYLQSTNSLYLYQNDGTDQDHAEARRCRDVEQQPVQHRRRGFLRRWFRQHADSESGGDPNPGIHRDQNDLRVCGRQRQHEQRLEDFGDMAVSAAAGEQAH